MKTPIIFEGIENYCSAFEISSKGRYLSILQEGQVGAIDQIEAFEDLYNVEFVYAHNYTRIFRILPNKPLDTNEQQE